MHQKYTWFYIHDIISISVEKQPVVDKCKAHTGINLTMLYVWKDPAAKGPSRQNAVEKSIIGSRLIRANIFCSQENGLNSVSEMRKILTKSKA